MFNSYRTGAARLARPVATLGLAVALVWLLASRIGDLDLRAVRDGILGVTPLQWALALVAVAVSFLAVGGQERVLHRHLGTGISSARAFQAGIAAAAISQTTGFGPVVGALVRWRLMPGLTVWQVTRLSVALTIGFLSCLAILASAVLVTTPHPTHYHPLGWSIVALAALAFLLGSLRPNWLPLRHHWPNSITMLAFLAWAALDLIALSATLWVLLPAAVSPPFALLLPAVLLALGAGLASGVPAGVGAFEMVALTLLPHVPPEALLAAILAWRAVFYALPALLAALWTALAPRGTPPKAAPFAHPPHLSPRAETGLAHQDTLQTLQTGRQSCLTGRTPHLLVALFEPFPDTPQADSLAALRHLARSENRLPVLYKVDARCAALARRSGMRVLRTAVEAVITPPRFDLGKPALSGLRRKLRKAAAAHVTVTRGHDPSCPILARINTSWALRHGGERGFSMGRFDPAYLGRQRLYVAAQAGQPIAFASFHSTAQEWTLDLLRSNATVPDGTMQTLIATAISDAAAQAVPRLSLAALPDLPPMLSRLLPSGTAGLARFKLGFAPALEGRYLCAQNLTTLAIAGLELTRAIHHPPALQPTAPQPETTIPHDTADYEFATVPASWHRKA